MSALSYEAIFQETFEENSSNLLKMMSDNDNTKKKNWIVTS